MNDARNIIAGVNLAEPHYSDNKSYSDRCGSFLREPYNWSYYELLWIVIANIKFKY